MDRCGPLQKDPVESIQHQSTDSSSSRVSFGSEEDWEELRVVVPVTLSLGVERERSAEEDCYREEDKLITTGTDFSVRHSQRATAGQHRNPFREPRSVQGMEAAAIPPELNYGLRPPSREVGEMATVLEQLLQVMNELKRVMKDG